MSLWSIPGMKQFVFVIIPGREKMLTIGIEHK
jgi:hypothetical protein